MQWAEIGRFVPLGFGVLRSDCGDMLRNTLGFHLFALRDASVGHGVADGLFLSLIQGLVDGVAVLVGVPDFPCSVMDLTHYLTFILKR